MAHRGRKFLPRRLLGLFDTGLGGEIPPELGNLSSLTRLTLHSNSLGGEIPPELGNLSSLTSLSLGYNSLTGEIPPELGNLSNLTYLSLGANSLAGLIPSSFVHLAAMERFEWRANEGLCAPGTAAFFDWLGGVNTFDSPYCHEADAAALSAFYDVTGGPSWTSSKGWLSPGPLSDWHGVSIDSLGRAEGIDLSRNNLMGALPGILGSLKALSELRVGGNALEGRLPLPLARLPLRELRYADTGLCVPGDASFRTWLSSIPSHEGTGVECAPLASDRDILVALYHATGGRGWTKSDNWLTDAPLRQWHGVQTDVGGRVIELNLFDNGLTGEISPELGNLASLTFLSLRRNRLTGGIPPELGNLASLTFLDLAENRLAGEIPPELGNLSSLTALSLDSNSLTGEIPPELGDPSSLTYLYLDSNSLTGEIPPELGNLSSLTYLYLHSNNLAGEIPPELGNPSSLTRLNLSNNDITGPVPRQVFLLSGLTELDFTDNSGLSGALPREMMDLSGLMVLLVGGTDLCAPRDAGFRRWLGTVPKRRVPLCGPSDVAAYLTQAVQSRGFPVPLVAGEPALLRVFVTAEDAGGVGLPPVRATFFRDGREVHTAEIPAKATPIPGTLDEGSLAASSNAEVPGRVVAPGLEMVVEVDPGGMLDPALGVKRRIPATGRLEVDVRAMPRFRLTVIPFLWREKPDSSILDITNGLTADDKLFGMTQTLLPVGEMDVAVHDPVWTSSTNAYQLIDETEAIRVAEGGAGHYMGTMPNPSGASGLAFPSARSSFSVPSGVVIAHELGHNMSLGHAPCGGAADSDPAYPYHDGAIGAWGYDFRSGQLRVPSRPDLMGFCSRLWISEYHFGNALRYRLRDQTGSASLAATPAKALLLWGGADPEGKPYLEPAFVVDAPPQLPDSAGEYRLSGEAEGGGTLFSFTFGMQEVADGDGGSSFAFAIPVRFGWESSLASITLSGPGGSVMLDGESDTPMAILRDPQTGQVRGFLRDLSTATQTAADTGGRTAGPGLEVLFSRGIPEAAAWRR